MCMVIGYIRTITGLPVSSLLVRYSSLVCKDLACSDHIAQCDLYAGTSSNLTEIFSSTETYMAGHTVLQVASVLTGCYGVMPCVGNSCGCH